MGDDDKKAAAMFREIENRIVWLAALLRWTSPEEADKALDAYQTRFAPIPADGPPC